MNKKIIILSVVVFISVVIGFFIFQEEEAESIKIGAIPPFTGAAAKNAISFQKGILLAAEEVNNSGGINGRPLEIVFADSQFTPEGSLKAFQKLESEHKPLMYISFPADFLIEVAKETKVVLLASNGYALTDPGDWVYNYTDWVKSAMSPLDFIFKQLNFKKLAIIYFDVQLGRNSAGLIEEVYREKGVEVTSIAVSPAAPQNYDFSKEIEQIKDSDALYLILSVEHRSILTQLQQADYKGAMIGSVVFAHPEVFVDPVAEGMYFVTIPIYNPDFIFAREVSEKFEAAYDKKLSLGSALGYDFIFLISEIMEGKEITRDSVRKTLEKGFTCSCTFGIVEVYEGEHNARSLLFPAKVVNGTLIYLQ